METRLQGLWNMTESLFTSYLNSTLPVGMAAKMAGANNVHSYFVLRALIEVPKELMDLGPIIKSDDLLKQVAFTC